MMDEVRRIQLCVYDALIEQSVDLFDAAAIAQQVGSALKRNEAEQKLFVVRITDSEGKPHDCVTNKLTDSSVLLVPIDIAGLRTVVRQEIAQERAVDERLSDSGTEV